LPNPEGAEAERQRAWEVGCQQSHLKFQIET
jgi:hypothetical protein